jgi:uncharacterized protein DUF3224
MVEAGVGVNETTCKGFATKAHTPSWDPSTIPGRQRRRTGATSRGNPMRLKWIAVLAGVVCAATLLSAQEKPMLATGTFDVKMTPQPDPGFDVGRMTIEKEFLGAITGTSKGMMLSSANAAFTDAGYVALEKVTGTLDGKRGSFVLQHSSTMQKGVATQSITVVPESGSGELAGLSGSMVITIEGKKHSYEFNYMITRSP